jgi:two-component system, NtrC family, response regulator AtoC
MTDHGITKHRPTSGELPSGLRIEDLFDRPLTLLSILDEIPLPVAILDADRRFRLANRALEGLTGFDREKATGIPCQYVLCSNLCPQQCPALAALEKHSQVSLEGNIINRNRQRIPVRVTSAAIRDKGSTLIGFVETIEDIGLLRRPDDDFPQVDNMGRILGQSPQMENVFRILPMVAQTDSSVLITGETGTGKDLLAEAIHQASGRASGPFIKINCGALPENLLESELFGHTKGAFTGAVENKPGRIRLAHNGTVYLTEIGDLSLPLQVKLLTFLDDQVVQPLGGTKGFQVDVRIIAATHRDLEEMVRENRFRADLLYRLNVIRVQIPPLRERGDDVMLLLDHFLSVFSSRHNKRIRGFSPEARMILVDYPYAGNVRELRNIIEYATTVCQGEQLSVEHLPAYLTVSRAHEPPAGRAAAALPHPNAAPVRHRDLQDQNWETVERQLILDALVQSKGRRGKAAAILGWSRGTLWRKMKQYEIGS